MEDVVEDTRIEGGRHSGCPNCRIGGCHSCPSSHAPRASCSVVATRTARPHGGPAVAHPLDRGAAATVPPI